MFVLLNDTSKIQKYSPSSFFLQTAKLCEEKFRPNQSIAISDQIKQFYERFDLNQTNLNQMESTCCLKMCETQECHNSKPHQMLSTIRCVQDSETFEFSRLTVMGLNLNSHYFRKLVSEVLPVTPYPLKSAFEALFSQNFGIIRTISQSHNHK